MAPARLRRRRAPAAPRSCGPRPNAALRSRADLPVRRALRLGGRLPAHQRRDREGLHAHLRHEPGHPRRRVAPPDRARADLDDLGRPRGRALRDPARAARAARGGAAGRLLQLRGGCRLPGAHALPRARAGDRQRPHRPADQEGPLLERRDQRAHGARLQPRLRPAADRARGDGARLQRRDHDAVALRAHGPGLRLRRPRDRDGVRRRPAGDRRGAAGARAALRDRRPQGEEGHRRDPEAPEPGLPLRRGRARARRAGAARADEPPHRARGGGGPARRATRSGWAP